MRSPRANLGLKINLALLLFFVALGVASSGVLIAGFSRTQHHATERSHEALEELGKVALRAVVTGAAEQGGLQFESASEIGQQAARYIESFREVGATTPAATTLARSEAGMYYDPNPQRVSDLVLLHGAVPDNPAVQDEIAYSAPLNAAFDALVRDSGSDASGRTFEASAIAFVGVHGASRYFPPIGLHELVSPDLDPTPTLQRVGPVANPERRTIWREPYEDNAGRGLVITAETPVYEGDTYRGLIQVDLVIQRLIDQIDSIQPTPNSFAFYVDAAGNLLRSNAFDLLSGEAADNTALGAILEAMKVPSTGEVDVQRISLQGEDFLIAHASMPSLGGSFGVAAPVSEITAEASVIASTIDDEGDRTLAVMLASLGGLLLVGLAGGTYLNRRMLLDPITRLVAGTREVGAGRLETALPVRSSDELGQLAEAFNHMTAELRESEQMLEQRVQERTRELHLLLDVSQNVASTLTTPDLAALILDQLAQVIAFDGAALLLPEGDESAILDASQRAGDSEARARSMATLTAGPALSAMQQRVPVVLPDLSEHAELKAWAGTLEDSAAAGRAWLSAPLIAQDRAVGVLNLWSNRPDAFGPEQVDLAMAVANQAAVAVENARLFRQASSVAALEERQRLARELHDSVSQALYGIALGAQTARQLLDTDVARAVQPVEYVLSLAEAGLAEMRALIFELRPESLASEGLVSALEKQAAATRARYAVDVVTRMPPEPDAPLDVKEAFYRVAQEAMHNTIKHARATRIELELTEDASVITLRFIDDGVGFDPGRQYPGHLGLHSMRERVEALSGDLRIESGPGQGTRIVASIPLRD